MTEFCRKDVFVNGLRLHTEFFGDVLNPACILIAGKMSTARFWTDAFCRAIASQGFFVIRYDHRDVGESSEIDWQKAPYTMSDLAKDAISVLDGYGIKQAHVIGNSMGGWICQRVGIDYSSRVFSLVIISSGPIEITEDSAPFLTEEEQKFLNSTLKIFSSRKDGSTLEETVQSYLPIWRRLNAEIPFDEDMAKKFTMDFLARTRNRNAGKNHDLMMNEFLSRMEKGNALQKIDRPTLVIHGDKDPVVLPRHGKAIADAIFKAKLIMIKGMGHSIFNRYLEEQIAKLVVEHCKIHL